MSLRTRKIQSGVRAHAVAAVSLILLILGCQAFAGSEPPAQASPRTIIRQPEEGLAYRLLPAPPGEGESASRLAVWHHPSGGRSYNAEAETLVPIFRKHGYSLLLPILKDFHGWTLEDARKLLGGTLPDVATLEGIDARRPLLLGFSSGGQVALELWMTKPELYGGLILDAAYPVEKRGERQVILGPPMDPAIKHVPVLAFVGALDPSLRVWQEAEEPWLRAGVPLTLRIVPNKGHAWLIEGSERELLDRWLAGVRRADAENGQAVSPPQEEPAPAVQP